MNKLDQTNIKKFSDLKLLPELLKAIHSEGYETPTPIQSAAIPTVLTGQDLLGIAQTGTGKTAAFSLPMLQNLMATRSGPTTPKSPRSLILVPTRELAIQVHKSLETYGKSLPMKYAVIFGGVGQGTQVQALARGVDALVATPGRLLDLINQKYIKLDKVEIFVLDEADRMLDMGFIRDIQKVLPLLPKKKQNLFFSATMPKEVQTLADSILHEPAKVSVTPQSTTVEKIQQKVLYVKRENKMNLLLHLLKDNHFYKVLVFVDMKHVANKVSEQLVKNKISAAAIHGNKSQGARQRAIEDFTKNKLRVLVATDIAARGIDIDGITHVINFDLPHLVESYVHRIGRTARAGAEGKAVSFCTGHEKAYLYAIEKQTRATIEVEINHPFHAQEISDARVMSVGQAKAMSESEKRGRRQQNGGGRGGGGGNRRRDAGSGSRSSSRSEGISGGGSGGGGGSASGSKKPGGYGSRRNNGGGSGRGRFSSSRSASQ